MLFPRAVVVDALGARVLKDEVLLEVGGVDDLTLVELAGCAESLRQSTPLDGKQRLNTKNSRRHRQGIVVGAATTSGIPAVRAAICGVGAGRIIIGEAVKGRGDTVQYFTSSVPAEQRGDANCMDERKRGR